MNTAKPLSEDKKPSRKALENPVRKVVIAFFLCFLVLPWSACALQNKLSQVSPIPLGMRVGWFDLLYSKEESWDPWYGEMGAGFRVYRMPEEVAEALERDGLAYLQSLPEKVHQWENYSGWERTPITPALPDSQWFGNPRWEGPISWPSPGIGDFLSRGIPLRIDEGWETLTNSALATNGSFLGYRARSMIILLPKERRIIQAYFD